MTSVKQKTIIYPWHQSSWDYYIKARSRNHLPHALLISGENGVGKQDFANRMVKSLLCINVNERSQQGATELDACNKCQACKTYDANANPDYLGISLLEDKQQIGVDQIRQLSEFLSYSRSFNSYRVVLINQVERMNQNAANSLLKSLEEPTDNTVIILLASQLSKLLPTIKSRCQILSLKTPQKAQAKKWIEYNFPETSNSEELLSMAYGRPVAALNIQPEEIESRDGFGKDILGVINKQIPITQTAKKWEKFDQELLLNWQITWVQNLIKQAISSDSNIEYSPDRSSKTMLELGKLKSENQLWKIYQQLLQQKQYIHTSVNPLMFVENMLMLWCK